MQGAKKKGNSDIDILLLVDLTNKEIKKKQNDITTWI